MKVRCTFCFVVVVLCSASAQNSKTEFSVMGKDLVAGRTIFGYIIEVENKRFDQVLVDTSRMLIKVRLTGVTKSGDPTLWRARSLAVYDLGNLQMKWSKNFPGMQTILMTDHYMTFSLYSAHSLNVNTGKEYWKIPPSLWYIDDKSGIGLSVDSKSRIQGITMATGKVLWERKMEKTFMDRNSNRLNDSTLLFNENGLQTLNLYTGEGWIYDATSMTKYMDARDIAFTTLDVATTLLGGTPMGGNKHIVRNIKSNVLLEGDRIYMVMRDRISCVTRKGKLVWERFFAKDTMSLMSKSSLISRNGRLYLINEGHAEINFLDKPYGKPFLASFSPQNGSVHFLTKFDYSEPIVRTRPTDSTVVVLTKFAIAEYRLTDGSRKHIKILKYEEPALDAFAPEELLFRSTEDTTRFGHIIAGDNKHYVLTEKQNLIVFDEALQELGKLAPEDYFVNWLNYKGHRFMGNARRTIVLDRSDKAVAFINLTGKSWMTGDRVYCAEGNKLSIVKLKDIIR